MSTARKTKPQSAAKLRLSERAKSARAAADAHIGQSGAPADGACCQASIIAARLGTLAAAWFEADAEGLMGSLEKTRLHERITTLSEAISYTRAASPAGMLAQLAVAFSAVDMTLNGRADLREPAARRAERCLLSIASALCALSGIDREGSGASYMMSGRIDWMACLAPEAA